MRTALARLVQVRAQLTDDLLKYLEKLESKLGENKLLEKAGRRLEGSLRVDLRVVPFEPVTDLTEIKAQEGFRRDGNLLRDHDDKFRRAYAQELDERVRAEQEARMRPRPLAELAAQLTHAVILGNPGSGKSEWLKYQARELAGRAWQQLDDGVAVRDQLAVPVFLRLDAIAGWLAEKNEGELKTLMSRLPRCQTTTGLSGDALRGGAAILRELHEQGMSERLQLWLWERMRPRAQRTPASGPPALVLYLDAWDEVSESREELGVKRSKLGECLRAFAEASPVRIFVTSRIIGYDPNHKPLPLTAQEDDNRGELRLCPFGWDETRQFIEAFYPDDEPHAQQLCGELRAKPALNGTAQNPLLATLLCLAYAPGQAEKLELPLRRSELYRRVLYGLLGEWANMKEGRANLVPPEVIRAKMDVLEQVAGYFFPDQIFSGKSHDKRKKGLDNILQAYKQSDALRLYLDNQKRTLLEELLQDGILLEMGGVEREYMFLHLTFQEYFTACFYAGAINAQAPPYDPFGDDETPAHYEFDRAKLLASHRAWRKIDCKAWGWVWHEVIIMLAGQLNDPQPLLDLLHDKQADDIHLHRQALAAETLAELTIAQQTRLQKQVNNITAGVFARWFRATLRHTNAALNHFPPTFPALVQAGGKLSVSSVLAEFSRTKKSAAYRESTLLEQLGQLLADENWDVRGAAAEAVGQLGSAAATPKFLARLGQLLAHEDNGVREAAVEAIGGIGNVAAVPDFLALLRQLLADKDLGVRQVAAEVLSKLRSAATPDFLVLLRQLLADERSRRVRQAAAVGGRAATPEVLARLLAHEDSATAGVVAYFQEHGLRIFAQPANSAKGKPAFLAITVRELAAGKRPVFG